MLPARGRGSHGSGFSALLKTPPSRPLNPGRALSDGLLVHQHLKERKRAKGYQTESGRLDTDTEYDLSTLEQAICKVLLRLRQMPVIEMLHRKIPLI